MHPQHAYFEFFPEECEVRDLWKNVNDPGFTILDWDSLVVHFKAAVAFYGGSEYLGLKTTSNQIFLNSIIDKYLCDVDRIPKHKIAELVQCLVFKSFLDYITFDYGAGNQALGLVYQMFDKYKKYLTKDTCHRILGTLLMNGDLSFYDVVQDMDHLGYISSDNEIMALTLLISRIVEYTPPNSFPGLNKNISEKDASTLLYLTHKAENNLVRSYQIDSTHNQDWYNRFLFLIYSTRAAIYAIQRLETCLFWVEKSFQVAEQITVPGSCMLVNTNLLIEICHKFNYPLLTHLERFYNDKTNRAGSLTREYVSTV